MLSLPLRRPGFSANSSRWRRAASGPPGCRIRPAGSGLRIRPADQACRTAASGLLDQVPLIAVEVFEDGDSAIGLTTGLLAEPDTGRAQPVVVPAEIVRHEKQADPSARLIADALALAVGVGQRQQQAGLPGARRGQ